MKAADGFLKVAESHAADLDARSGFRKAFPEMKPSDLEKVFKAFQEDVFKLNATPFNFFVKNRSVRKRVQGCPLRFPAAATLIAYLRLNMIIAAFAEVGYAAFANLLRAPTRSLCGAVPQ